DGGLHARGSADGYGCGDLASGRSGCDPPRRSRCSRRAGWSGTGRGRGRRMSDTTTGAGTGPVGPAQDGNLQDIHRLPDLHTAETLPPAKGDSDLRGSTPDDMEPPDDALLVVRQLKKYFP